jgi:hypothetical protein
METVQFDDTMKNFSDALDSAGRINTEREISRIIHELNETSFETSKILIRFIKQYIDELEPCDPYDTIRHIIENLSESHKTLLDPVNMIMNTNKKLNLLRCFSRA